MKHCRICGKLKPFDDFYRASGMRDGRRNECKPCFQADRKAKYNSAEAVARVKGWQERNPERLDAYRAEYRNRPARKRAMRDLYYRRNFGITADEVDALLAGQGGKCAICDGVSARAEGWHVDHNHETGQIRGVLCQRCNHGIGLLEEDPARLRAAADYLESASR
jgi:hypothetical protein